VFEDCFGFERDVGRGFKILLVEPPKLLAAVPPHGLALAVPQVVEELVYLLLFLLVEKLGVFEELAQRLEIQVQVRLEAIRKHFHRIDGDRLAVLGVVLVLHGVENVLG
jgi:hypothetical protein